MHKQHSVVTFSADGNGRKRLPQTTRSLQLERDAESDGDAPECVISACVAQMHHEKREFHAVALRTSHGGPARSLRGAQRV